MFLRVFSNLFLEIFSKLFSKKVSLPNGLRLDKGDMESASTTVTTAQIPNQLIFPLQLPNGSVTSPTVNVDDYVFKGQLIAKENDPFSVPIHASSSGIITAIQASPTSHPSGVNTTCIKLKTDGKDKWIKTRRSTQNKYSQDKYSQLSPKDLRERIQKAGIMGMGGAGFPSAIKLGVGKKYRIDTLILNGAECEPYVSCDDMLMQTQADAIIEGAQIMMLALQTRHCIIAVEDNKEKAITTLRAALRATLTETLGAALKIEISSIPTLYPLGDEKQLIKLLTNKHIAKNRRPYEYGLICHNVATAAATYRAICFNEPLISRIVTVTGVMPQVKNMKVLIGTSVDTLIEICHGETRSFEKIIMGGPMMGTALHSSKAPIDKTTLCIIAQSDALAFKLRKPFASRSRAMPCIRCGACADACPVNLLPQQIFWHAQAKEIEKTNDFHVLDCIECGCCDYVCPSHIPLIQYFRYAKTEIRALDKEKAQSNIARQRHESRVLRLARDKKEQAERHQKKIDELAR